MHFQRLELILYGELIAEWRPHAEQTYILKFPPTKNLREAMIGFCDVVFRLLVMNEEERAADYGIQWADGATIGS